MEGLGLYEFVFHIIEQSFVLFQQLSYEFFQEQKGKRSFILIIFFVNEERPNSIIIQM